MADGSRHSLRIIEETTRGTTPSTPTWLYIRHNSCSISLTKDTFQSEEIRNDRQIADFRHGAKQVGGDVASELSYGGAFDDILEAVLGGTWAVDTPSSGIDQLKAGTSRRYFSIERYFADILTADKPYHRFVGCEFNTMSLSIGANAIVTASFGVIGKDVSLNTGEVASSTYSAVTTTSPYDSFTGTLNEGGSAIAIVTELSINLDNGLEQRFVVGSATPIQPSIGRSNVTGTVTAYFENEELIEKFINETESSIDITLLDSAGNSLFIDLPRVKYTGAPPDVSGDGPITLTMPFQALYNTSDATNIIVQRDPA